MAVGQSYLGDDLLRQAARRAMCSSRASGGRCSRFREDGAAGVHDMMIAACDQARYEFFGHEGPHASCSENLCVAMRRLGHQVDVVPQPINFFTNAKIEEDGRLMSPPNPVKPGAYVVLEALIDTICVVSSCPFDLKVDGWAINAAQGPSELLVEVGGQSARSTFPSPLWGGVRGGGPGMNLTPPGHA